MSTRCIKCSMERESEPGFPKPVKSFKAISCLDLLFDGAELCERSCPRFPFPVVENMIVREQNDRIPKPEWPLSNLVISSLWEKNEGVEGCARRMVVVIHISHHRHQLNSSFKRKKCEDWTHRHFLSDYRTCRTARQFWRGHQQIDECRIKALALKKSVGLFIRCSHHFVL